MKKRLNISNPVNKVKRNKIFRNPHVKDNLIILLHKINIGNMSTQEWIEGRQRYLKYLQSIKSEKVDIKHIIFPVKNQDSDVKLIYPIGFKEGLKDIKENCNKELKRKIKIFEFLDMIDK